jgi:hypothetical protein
VRLALLPRAGAERSPGRLDGGGGVLYDRGVGTTPPLVERIEREGIGFKSSHGAVTVARLGPSVVVVRVVGRDAGSFGAGPLEEVATFLREAGRADLFIDAREALGASLDVGAQWAGLFRAQRPRLGGVSILVRAKFIQLTADLVRQISELGEAMRIYTDEAAFDEALSAALG